MLTDRIITAAVFALMHSLWQAFIIALLLLIFTKTAVKAGSKLKYSASFFSLITVSASSAFTFIYYFKNNRAVSAPAVHNINDFHSVQVPAGSITSAGWQNILESNSWLIFALWFAGMTVFFIKFCVDLYYTNSIRRKDHLIISDAVTASFYSIAEKLGIKKAVVFIESPLVKVPAVIGYLKPVVILPLGLVSKIPSDQLEAVISHELAHIARNDFLHNLIQSLIEIVYFFNPSVFIISGMIRSERENCCDDLAVTQCGDSALLAKGLYNLELIHSDLPGTVMAAAGKKKNLLCRIKRLIGKENDMTKTYSGFFASLAVLTIITVITGCTLFAAGDKEEVKKEKEIKVIVTSDDGKGSNCGDELEFFNFNGLQWAGDSTNAEFQKIQKELEAALKELEKFKGEDKIKIEEKVKSALKQVKDHIKDIDKKIKQIKVIRKDSDGTKIIIGADKKMEVRDDKIIIMKDGKEEVIDIDRKKLDDLKKKAEELKKKYGLDIRVIDGDDDVLIYTGSDSLEKEISIIRKKDLAGDLTIDKDVKWVVIDKDDDLEKIEGNKWVKKGISGDFDKLWDELIKDGLFKEKSDKLKIEIEDDEIEINNVEIPEKLFDKYKKLLEGA